MATSSAPERLPCFVYGTLQRGYKNFANVVKNRHKQLVPARLRDCVVFDFKSRGFPGAVPLKGRSALYEEFASQASPETLESIEILTSGPSQGVNAEGCELAKGAGVIGQLLWFEESDWPSAANDLDALEAYFGPFDSRNMYYRARVQCEVLEASSRAPSQPSSRRGSLIGTSHSAESDTAAAAEAASSSAPTSGAGAMPAPQPVPSSGFDDNAFPKPAVGTLVDCWVYFCLLDPRQPALNSCLVEDGFWKRHLLRTGQTDAGDDWSECLEEGNH